MFKIHVLYLEDNPLDVDLVQAILDQSDLKFNLDTVDSKDLFVKALQSKTYDLILSDYVLPSFSGPEAIQTVQNMKLEIPVIIVSGKLGEEAAIETLKLGAIDYVLKTNLKLLLPAIRRGMHQVAEIRKRSKAENQLKENEKAYRSFFNDVPLGLYRCNASWEIILINKRLLSILGFSDQTEEVNHFLTSCFVDKTESDYFFKTLESEQLLEQFEAQWKCAAGEMVYVRLNVHAVSDDDDLQYYEGSVEDITQLKKAESQLLHERHLLNSFIENVPDNIYFKDDQSRFLRINQSMSRLFGLQSPVLALGMSDFDFFAKDHAQPAFDDERQIMKTGEALSKEEKETWMDGHVSWVWTHKMPLKDREGNIIGTFGISRNITAQKEAEEKLKEQNELMDALMDNIPDSIFFKNSAGEYIVCNQAMADSIGLKNKELIVGSTDSDYFTKSFEEGIRKEEKHLMETSEPVIGKVHQVPFKKSKKLADRWYSTTKVPIKDNEGNISGLVGISRDITEFKSAQEAFIASEEKYHTVFESSSDAVLLIDYEGIIDCNEATINMFGYKEKSDIIGKQPSDISPKLQENNQDSVVLSIQKIDEAYHSGTCYFDWIYKKSDGSPFPAEVTLTAFPLNGKKVILAMIHDVTERVLAIKAIQRYFDVFKNMEIGICIYRLDDLKDEKSLRLVEMNPSAEHLLNISYKQSVGKNFVNIFPDFREKKFLYQCADVVRKKEAIDFGEIQFSENGNGVKWFAVRAFPQPDQSVSLTFEDVTKKKEMEGLLHLGQKLESIGQLAAGIAHEINTPTQYVSDNTRFLQDAFKDVREILDSYQQMFEYTRNNEGCESLVTQIESKKEDLDFEYLLEEIPNAIDQSLEGVDRVSKIVRAMKDFSHPGSTDHNTIDINKTIETTIMVSRNEWKYLAELEMDFDETLPLVSCYADEFNQVILNLVTNAAHAIEDANKKLDRTMGKIKISTQLTSDGDYLQIRIKDNGLGIPKSNHDKIFDPFFTTKEVGKGTGQGLAIAHNIIVTKHNGRLSFNSEENKGTEFIIELPVS